MSLGLLLNPRGLRPYASVNLRPHRAQKLTPSESVAFAIMFLLAIVVAAAIVGVVFR